MSATDATIAEMLQASGLSLSGEVPAAANCCRTHGSTPPVGSPRYIDACFHQKWKLATWSKSDPNIPVKWRPARCMSWRHAGPCALAKASQDYARIKIALSKYDRKHITYLVLTLDPSAWTGEGWSGWAGKTPERRADALLDQNAISAAYLSLRDRWRQLAKAMRKKWGDFQYVSTVESHRSGWPHLNVILVSPSQSADVVAAHERLQGWGRKAAGREAARQVLGSMLPRSGFGCIAFAESALALESDGEDRLAAYIAKLAGETGTAWDGQARGLVAAADDAPVGAQVHSIEGKVVSEISKLSQAPVRAPDHFRRLRSSKGFLPPVEKNEDLTGAMFDEKNNPIGRDQGDRLILAAQECGDGQAKDELRRQISGLVDHHQDRFTFEDGTEQEKLKRKTQAKIVGKLHRALRILDGRDARQLLKAAMAAQTGSERVAVLAKVDRELEILGLHREEEKRFGVGPLSMISAGDARRLKQAEAILMGLLQPENETLTRGAPLSVGLGRELRSEQDLRDFCRVFASGAAFTGQAARKYRLGTRYAVAMRQASE